MKKIYLAMLLLSVFAFGCKKSTTTKGPTPYDNISVSRVQESFATIISATWCPACYWGDSIFGAIVGTNPTTINAVGLHFSGSDTFYCSVAADMTTYFESGPPYGGGTVHTYPSFNEGIKTFDNNYVDFQAAVNTTLANTSPECAVGLSKSISGTTMTVLTKVHFYVNKPTGNYQVAVYVTEDNLSGTQNDEGVAVYHFVQHHVLRASIAGTNYLGYKFSSAPTSGSDYDNTFTVKLDPSWVPANLHVVAVVYNVANGQMVNVYNSHGI